MRTMSRKLSMAAAVLALWLGALHPAMLLASCPLPRDQSGHGCCPRTAPMPDCPSPRCFTAPDRGTHPGIVAKFTAAAVVEPLPVAFAARPESRIVAGAVTATLIERDRYLKIRVLLI